MVPCWQVAVLASKPAALFVDIMLAVLFHTGLVLHRSCAAHTDSTSAAGGEQVCAST
jgi:hypothetical protein